MAIIIASNISTIAALDAAITTADGEGASATPYEIVLQSGADIQLTQALEAINLKSGVSLNIVGIGATLDGLGNQRGLFVYSGVVSITDLTVENAAAVGGAGGRGAGGGAGRWVVRRWFRRSRLGGRSERDADQCHVHWQQGDWRRRRGREL